MKFRPGLGRWDAVKLQERSSLLLLLIVLSALFIRTCGAVLFAGELDGEGTEYARIAQNLIAGKGYVGISTPGTQLFFPPLFPFLIAGVTWTVGNAEVAARIVSVLFGTLLVLPVYLIARRMFGQRTALAAATLTAFHPYLIMFSVSVFCELTFLTLVLAATYSAMHTASNPTARALAASGALYGVSFLVRSEAFIYMLVGFGCVLLARLLLARDKLRSIAGRVLLIPLLFFVVAGPYIGWLSMHAGHLRLEGRSPLNVAIDLRMATGLSANQAAYGVEGVFQQPNIDTIESHRLSLSGLAIMIKRKTKTVLENAAVAVAVWLSPALFALAILGLFSRAWGPSLALDQLHLLALLAISIFATYFIYFTQLRFYLPILVFFSIWACAANNGLKLWAQRSASLFGLGSRQQRVVAAVAWSLAVAAVILPAAVWTIHSFISVRGTRPIKAVGESMAAVREPLRIADVSAPFAFHARAELVWLPDCDEATALQFLNEKQVTHIVVRSNHMEWRSYFKKWLADGVPDARLTAQVISGTGDKVQVYELRRLGGA